MNKIEVKVNRVDSGDVSDRGIGSMVNDQTVVKQAAPDSHETKMSKEFAVDINA